MIFQQMRGNCRCIETQVNPNHLFSTGKVRLALSRLDLNNYHIAQPALAGKTGLERLNLAAERFSAFATEQNKYYEILFLTMDHTVEHKVKGALVKDATVSQVFMVDRVRECMA